MEVISDDEEGACSQHANTIATLPTCIRKIEVGTEILPLPSSKKITPGAKDTLNLQVV